MNRRDMVTALIASAAGLTVAKSLPASDDSRTLVQGCDMVHCPALRASAGLAKLGASPLEVRNVVHPWNPNADAMKVLTSFEIEEDGVLVMHWMELQFVGCETS